MVSHTTLVSQDNLNAVTRQSNTIVIGVAHRVSPAQQLVEVMELDYEDDDKVIVTTANMFSIRSST